MIENKGEVVDILVLAKKYFLKMREIGKKSIVTFSEIMIILLLIIYSRNII